MKYAYAYVEGFAGNGFEDAGVEIHEIKLFANKADAISYCVKKFVELANEFLGEDCEDDTIEEMADALNGTVDLETGHWEVSPESTSFGTVKELK